MPKNPESFGDWLKLEKPEHILGFLLKSLQHTLRQRIDEALRKQGVELSFAQFAALFNLQSDPGVTGARLARRAFVSAQTMNSALRALEQDGYIERRPHPSGGRADSWSLTEAGLAELTRARQVGIVVFDRMLAEFNAKEIAAFVDYLRRCIAALGGDPIAAVQNEPPRSRAERRWRRGAAG
ncbi:MAG TPA: MarR family transcriptional regulator [Gammaproteobacteria bacterium]